MCFRKSKKAEQLTQNNTNRLHLLATKKKATCYTKLRQFDLAIQTLEQIKLSNPQDKAALENYLRALNIRANIHYSNYEDEFAIKNTYKLILFVRNTTISVKRKSKHYKI
ncbi:hypothetical protein H9X57_07435 [Flavobacterium piscinae]|uniref:hypothetical protein n=1 Tax=Flavobacterium piscinae TaxID=2506424 RepID=UPI0019B8A9FB|nr:hypothetical protein [Flavobacterium piscinae]MBC8883312.1 hypothetical protein [Flavobacterium piscinae]